MILDVTRLRCRSSPSTVRRRRARARWPRQWRSALGFHYLDSGALYRLVALAATEAGVEPERRAAGRRHRGAASWTRFEGGEIWLGRRRVTDDNPHRGLLRRLREWRRLPAVREALLERQRAFRRPPGLVADGRDMGSVVFPGCRPSKCYLTANVEARAERRYKQLKGKRNRCYTSRPFAGFAGNAMRAMRLAARGRLSSQDPDALPLDTTAMSDRRRSATPGLVAGTAGAT